MLSSAMTEHKGHENTFPAAGSRKRSRSNRPGRAGDDKNQVGDPRRPSPKRRPRQADPGEPPRRDGARAAGRTWLYGFHTVLAAIANPNRLCHHLLATAPMAETLRALPDKAQGNRPLPGLEVVEGGEIGRRLPRDAVHQGMAVQVDPLPPASLEDVLSAPAPAGRDIVVLIDRASDPRNIGAVMRSAAAFGARAVLLPARHSPENTPALAKAASGALDRIPLIRVPNLNRAMILLKSRGYWIVGLAADAQEPLWRVDLGNKVALAVGSEGEGLRRLTQETCDTMVSIPMTTHAGSLNLSAAAAVALYELSRNSGGA